MKKILDLITDEVTKAFTDCGYDAKYGKVTLSNRPDLCEYQCNGAMAAAKEYKKAPFMIADEVAAKLAEASMFSMTESVKPAVRSDNGCIGSCLPKNEIHLEYSADQAYQPSMRPFAPHGTRRPL